MKRYILLAGVNGAGKSTLYQTNVAFKEISRINVDEIVREVGDWKNTRDVMKAGRIAVQKLNQLFEDGLSINQETTLCGRSIINNMYKAKKMGYRIELYYIGLDTADTAKQRVEARVKVGGHGIPEEDIERRYYESLKQLKKVIPVCDTVVLYDNTIAFSKVAVFEEGKCVYQSADIPLWAVKILE